MKTRSTRRSSRSANPRTRSTLRARRRKTSPRAAIGARGTEAVTARHRRATRGARRSVGGITPPELFMQPNKLIPIKGGKRARVYREQRVERHH